MNLYYDLPIEDSYIPYVVAVSLCEVGAMLVSMFWSVELW